MPPDIHFNGPSVTASAGAAAGVDHVGCCYGSAVYGPDSCTCWVPVFDLEQQPLQEGPMSARSTCCEDCAFRNGSPEREADELAFNAARVFACHQGIRRPTTSTRSEAPSPVTRPTTVRRSAATAYGADGRPGEVCAGWAAYAGVHVAARSARSTAEAA